jgi:GTP-dependent phosphoenolpyruvate carboxykinase
MESGFTSLRNHDLEKARKWLSEQLEILKVKEPKVKSGFMKGQCPAIRGPLCQLAINDLDYLIKHSIFADDVQAVQSAIIHIGTEERAKESREQRQLGKWQEENA